MNVNLLIIGVVLALAAVHGDDEDSDTGPSVELPEVDQYCVDPPPTFDGPCNERKIWTFDYDQRQCVKISGCFEEAGPEYNMFSSKLGCQRWCFV